ncbi:MAG: 2OG-Fe dioxygenase family protein [Coleofasciculaceae cyanobacterium SM2_1_6]|nr:2OG-Fe dioxygenase family protein [Coleofasciculaceae cyanobacterium SM2_1_6]
MRRCGSIERGFVKCILCELSWGGQTTAITPEGIHSDGYPFAGLHLLDRRHIMGGETTIYQPEATPLAKITFEQPLDSLWLEDRHLQHSVTEIACSLEQADEKGIEAGYRDLLAISFSLPDSIYSKKI